VKLETNARGSTEGKEGNEEGIGDGLKANIIRIKPQRRLFRKIAKDLRIRRQRKVLLRNAEAWPQGGQPGIDTEPSPNLRKTHFSNRASLLRTIWAL
jgi:hypothetical protein